MAQQIYQSGLIADDNIYVYEFGGPTNTKSGMNYAPHTAELSFVFDWEDEDEWLGVPWSQSLSNSMVSAWTNFGMYGIPNTTNTIDSINIIWSKFNDDSNNHGQNVMVWDDTGIMVSNFSGVYRNGSCNFMNKPDDNKAFSMLDICKDNSYP